MIFGVQTAARAPFCPLLFRYSQTEQNEGALARTTCATHKDTFGQPARTFGAHRGADLKHQSHPKYSPLVPVPKLYDSREGFHKPQE